MLQLILGIVGTGKSTLLMREMQKCAANKQQCVFLVPEQFSSSAEGICYRTLGDEKSGFVQVLSFRTLAEKILRHSGSENIPVLTEAGRVVFVRRAVSAVGDKLKAFARHKRSMAFCSLCAQAITELKTAGASPEKVNEIALSAEDDKLLEIAMIFKAYEEILRDVALDSEDRLTRATKAAKQSGWLKDKVCFIDGFDGFTPTEMQMLGQLLWQCDEVSIALCCDSISKKDGGYDVFEPVRRAARAIKHLCEERGIAQKPEIILREPKRAKTQGLVAANFLYAGNKEVNTAQSNGVYATECEDEWQEVLFCASEMYRLAQSGVPYAKMALVCRDINRYEPVVKRQLALYNIPCFIDDIGNIEHTPAIAFMRAALSLLRAGLVSEHILALVKTGLCGYEDEEIAALENYAFTWQPKAKDWRNIFDKNPLGLLQKMSDEARNELQKAESVRAQVVPRICEFIQRAHGCTADELCRQLYYLMDAFDAAGNAQKQEDILEDGGLLLGATAARRAWDLAMDILDAMAAMLADEKIGADEFDELLVIMVRNTDFGHAPQTLESAVFTSAERMRLTEVDYCFLLGVCEGEFPMQVGYSGLLNHIDRDLLVQNGIEMPGSFENRMLLEDMFFYRALCAPKEGLYISWPKRRMGEGKMRSSALEALCNALNPASLTPESAQLAATPAAAYELLCEQYRENNALGATLYTALCEDDSEEMQSAIGLLKDVDNSGMFKVDDYTSIKRLVGDNMRISPSAAEKYYTCRFAYYIERVLKLKSRRKAQLTHMESGTFVHYVLEKVLGEVKDNLPQVQNETLENLVQGAKEKFLAENTITQSRREEFLLEQVTQNCVKLLCFLRDMAAQSSFKVDALELEIGETGGIPPLKVVAESGADVSISGKVDRVDTYSHAGNTYLCVIDYKTGDKKLNLDEIYCGTNMQMMIYMDALRNAQNRYPNALPAAALYLWSEPAPSAKNRRESSEQPYKLMGLLTDDTAVLNALDSGKNGSYIPVKYKKDGSVTSSSPVVNTAGFNNILQHVEDMVAKMADGVYAGDFAATPLVSGQNRPCRYCEYRAACRHEDGVNEKKLEAPQNAFEHPAREQVRV